MADGKSSLTVPRPLSCRPHSSYRNGTRPLGRLSPAGNRNRRTSRPDPRSFRRLRQVSRRPVWVDRGRAGIGLVVHLLRTPKPKPSSSP